MSKHLKIEQQAAAWLAKKDGGRWSALEQTELEQWLGLATAHRVAYLRLKAAWSKTEAAATAIEPGLQSSQTGHPPDETSRRSLPRFSHWRIAAAILLTVGATGTLMFLRAAPAEVRYETQLGVHQSHALQDGSTLTLNTATLVRAQVGPAGRTVWLDKGEAYFDVAHDTAHPFVVIAGTNRITVLGTKFSVRRDASQINVLVIDGRVQVENAQIANKPAVVLIKHQKAVASAANVLKSEESEAGVEQTLSWREGKLVFDQSTLDYAAREFNRYNKTKLVMADAAAAKVQIGGRFDVGNVRGFAKLLQHGFGLDVSESGDTISISSRKPMRGSH